MPFQNVVTFAIFMVMSLFVDLMESACPPNCMCRWKGGKATVECINLGLETLPANIAGGTQVLDMSRNSLQVLPEDMFIASGLQNLQRISLASCKIGRVDDNAFSRLSNLVELDLSNNLITAIPSETFKDFPRLRKLFLNDNPITRIENDAFLQLPALNTLEFSRCRIETVMPRAFDALNLLTSLKVDGNRLRTIPGKALNQLVSLHAIEIQENPWHCDCQLNALKYWLITTGVPYRAVCASPESLGGYDLERVTEEDLKCSPIGVGFKPRNRVVKAVSGDSVFMLVHVSAFPEAHVQWIWKGKVLVNMSSVAQGSQIYMIHENGTTEKISTLTITPVVEVNSGDYVCVAENSAGRYATNFTLYVEHRDVQLAVVLSTTQLVGIGFVVLGFVAVVLGLLLITHWKKNNDPSEKTKVLNKTKSEHCVNYSICEKSKDQYELDFLERTMQTGELPEYINQVSASLYECDNSENMLGINGERKHSASVVCINRPDIVQFEDGAILETDASAGLMLLQNENKNNNYGKLLVTENDTANDAFSFNARSPQSMPYDFQILVNGGINGPSDQCNAEVNANKDVPTDPSGMSNSLSAYDVGVKREGPCRDWREHPALVMITGERLPQSRSQYTMGSDAFDDVKKPIVRLYNAVPVLPAVGNHPFVAFRVTHSPDEGYEDEGEEGTEV